jgi:hypothetical protein
MISGGGEGGGEGGGGEGEGGGGVGEGGGGEGEGGGGEGEGGGGEGGGGAAQLASVTPPGVSGLDGVTNPAVVLHASLLEYPMRAWLQHSSQ